VASAGYGLDLMTAIDILKTIRSAYGFVVTIILKPFSFEGQRRQDEVLLQNLDHTCWWGVNLLLTELVLLGTFNFNSHRHWKYK
jgi:hypothetical protein